MFVRSCYDFLMVSESIYSYSKNDNLRRRSMICFSRALRLPMFLSVRYVDALEQRLERMCVTYVARKQASLASCPARKDKVKASQRTARHSPV